MKFENYALSDWLEHIQNQHWRTMDLTLDRVRQVWRYLGGAVTGYVIVVAGTNGKGSAVSMLNGVLIQSGKKTGVYTSPHLVRYNERIKINDEEVGDEEICEAFRRIERFRDNVSLTYFEYSTLCALLIFQKHRVDVMLLEVGMGGRLDAVNMIENDMVLITFIGIDHQRWLGATREQIAAEKAGVINRNGTVVCADKEVPRSVIEAAARKQARLVAAEKDYFTAVKGRTINWSSDLASVPAGWRQIDAIVSPLNGDHQAFNLGGVIAVLAVCSRELGIDVNDLQPGLDRCKLRARCQYIQGPPDIIMDVAHNEDAARKLAEFVDDHRNSGRTIAVFGVLEDKDLEKIIMPMKSRVDYWILASLKGERGQSAEKLAEKLDAVIDRSCIECHDSPVNAYRAALAMAADDDRIVIFGSFHTVGDIIGFTESGRPYSQVKPGGTG